MLSRAERIIFRNVTGASRLNVNLASHSNLKVSIIANVSSYELSEAGDLC